MRKIYVAGINVNNFKLDGFDEDFDDSKSNMQALAFFTLGLFDNQADCISALTKYAKENCSENQIIKNKCMFRISEFDLDSHLMLNQKVLTWHDLGFDVVALRAKKDSEYQALLKTLEANSKQDIQVLQELKSLIAGKHICIQDSYCNTHAHFIDLKRYYNVLLKDKDTLEKTNYWDLKPNDMITIDPDISDLRETIEQIKQMMQKHAYCVVLEPDDPDEFMTYFCAPDKALLDCAKEMDEVDSLNILDYPMQKFTTDCVPNSWKTIELTKDQMQAL